MPTEKLPPLSTSDRDIAAWVGRRLVALDDTPTRRNWRWEAQGRRSVGQVMAEAPDHWRFSMGVPLPEARLVAELAEARQIHVQTYLRRAAATVMVACDDVDPELIPFWSNGGLIRPR
jgi:hypothetical protein